jgi:hypothetical protein
VKVSKIAYVRDKALLKQKPVTVIKEFIKEMLLSKLIQQVYNNNFLILNFYTMFYFCNHYLMPFYLLA